MRRRAFRLLRVPLLLGGAWLYGRAPSAALLADRARRAHADRAERFGALQARLAALPEGEAREAAAARVDALLRETKRTAVRGWDVLLIPPGAPRPDAAGWLRAGSERIVEPGDPPQLRGAYEIWVAPRGLLARAVHAVSG